MIPEPTSMSRRSFLAAIGTAVVGASLLSAIPSAVEASGTVPTFVLMVRRRIHRLIVSPVWATDEEREQDLILWTERGDEPQNPVRVKFMQPETLEEWDEVNLFCQVVKWRRWKNFDELQLLLQKPGPWMIRLNINENYSFLTTTDEAILADDEALVYDSNPEKAVRLDSRTAFNVIRRLTQESKLSNDDPYIYFEPVERQDAATNFRELAMQHFASAYTPQGENKARLQAIQREMAALKGSWKTIERIDNGSETGAEAIQEQVIALDQGRYTLREGEEIFDVLPFSVDPSKSPKFFNLAADEDDTEIKGNCQLGIYKIDGDTLSICISPVGRFRPTEFTSNKGSFRILTRYKRCPQ